MKVLYFHQHFSTNAGSTGTRSFAFAKELVKRGHTVTMVCGSNWVADTGLSKSFVSGKRKGIVDEINIIEFDLNYSNSDGFINRTITFFKYAFFGINIAYKGDFDIVFATSTPLTAGIPGIISKVFKDKPFIFEVRDLWPELPRAMGVIKNPLILKLMDILETVTYKYSDACVGLSPGIVEGVKKKYPKKRVELIPNGCDFNIVPKLGSKKRSNNKFVAAFTGAHGYANGLDSVLDVAELMVKKNISQIEFHFIGDGALKPELMKRSKKQNLTNCIFVDPISKVELFEYLTTNVDVGLMILKNIPAFYYGTSPNKFFDYISLGLPIINNYPGWLADMINKNNCGIVVKPNQTNDFMEALILLKKEKSLRDKMGRNSLILAKNKFDRKNLSLQFVKFLESMEH